MSDNRFNGLTDEENKKYVTAAYMTVIFYAIYVITFIALLWIIISMFVYWYNNDTLGFMQVLKPYLGKIIVFFIINTISRIIGRTNYESYKYYRNNISLYNRGGYYKDMIDNKMRRNNNY